MKKFIKCGIVAAVAVAAGFAAYQSYGSYGVQDSSLLMQNVEALAQISNGDPGGTDGGDPNGDNKDHKECRFPADFVECWGPKGPADFQGWSWTHRKSEPRGKKCKCYGSSESQDCPKGTYKGKK